MMKHQVRDEKQALLYLTGCTLATVSHMAMLKSKSKSEFERQKAIAQTGIDWIRDFKINTEKNSRVNQVFETKTKSVEEWVEKYENLIINTK
jgi:hypothetical protein